MFIVKRAKKADVFRAQIMRWNNMQSAIARLNFIGAAAPIIKSNFFHRLIICPVAPHV